MMSPHGQPIASQRVTVVVPSVLRAKDRCSIVRTLILANQEVTFLTSSAAALAVDCCSNSATVQDLLRTNGKVTLFLVEVAEQYLCTSCVTILQVPDAAIISATETETTTVCIDAVSGTNTVGLADADSACVVAWIAGLLKLFRSGHEEEMLAVSDHTTDPSSSSSSSSSSSNGHHLHEATLSPSSSSAALSSVWHSVSSAATDNSTSLPLDNSDWYHTEDASTNMAGIPEQHLVYAETIWQSLSTEAKEACCGFIKAHRNYLGSSSSSNSNSNSNSSNRGTNSSSSSSSSNSNSSTNHNHEGYVDTTPAVSSSSSSTPTTHPLTTEETATKLLALVALRTFMATSGPQLLAAAQISLKVAMTRYYGRRAHHKPHGLAVVNKLRRHLVELLKSREQETTTAEAASSESSSSSSSSPSSSSSSPSSPLFDMVVLWSDSAGISAALSEASAVDRTPPSSYHNHHNHHNNHNILPSQGTPTSPPPPPNPCLYPTYIISC